MEKSKHSPKCNYVTSHCTCKKAEDNVEFEKSFKKKGINAQRRYPNEYLIQFLAHYYFPSRKRNEKKILEIGVGSGANSWMIAREGFDTYGIDNSKTGLKLCKKVHESWGVSVKLKLGTMRKLPYQNGFFDCIVDVVSMQHLNLEGHEETYNEIYRCLKKGGRFFSYHLEKSTDYFDPKKGMVDNSTMRDFLGNGQACFLDSRQAENFLKSSGFKDISIGYNIRKKENIFEYLLIEAKK